MKQQIINSSNDYLLEKVITSNDLAGLSPIEKVQYIKNVCESLGLNPLTRPIQLIKFQGKEVMYFSKDATEQLRKIHNISITNLDTKINDGLYIVTATARCPDGRTDASTSAISIKNLSGDALCNAVMKGETKAKRRVTLSICGLGMMDESELDTLPAPQKVVYMEEVRTKPAISHSSSLEEDIYFLSKCSDISELSRYFTEAVKRHKELGTEESLKVLIESKDINKIRLQGIHEGDAA